MEISGLKEGGKEIFILLMLNLEALENPWNLAELCRPAHPPSFTGLGVGCQGLPCCLTSDGA